MSQNARYNCEKKQSEKLQKHDLAIELAAIV
jgi:hypothetical protein